MKKVLFTLLMVVVLAACSSKIYNNALKQIELGMSPNEVTALMGDQYNVVSQRGSSETLEYVDRFKNHWFFVFENNSLVKWYKEVEK
ncbi:MAG: lipoprotein [Dysgonomonas sp.]